MYLYKFTLIIIKKNFTLVKFFGASCRSRTNNLLITSQLLCHWANEAYYKIKMATQKGLEPSTSGVTGQHSNQLSYWAIIWWKQQGSNLWPSACKADALPAELCFHIKWWPLGESNPCYHRERVVSWPLDQGAIKWSFISESN